MRKNILVLLVLIGSSFILSGCGGDGDGNDSSTPSSPEVVSPSATELPYGITSMNVPVDDDETIVLDFTYNDQGQLVELSGTNERDFDNDGRADSIVRTVYTIDPTIEPNGMPDLEFFSPKLAAPLGKAPSPVILDYSEFLPGAVVEITNTQYGYGGLFRSVSEIPEDMIPERQQTVILSYDTNGDLLEIESTSEDSRSIDTLTMTLTYDETGSLIEFKSVMQIDELKDGWIDENDVLVTTLSYDEAGNLVEMVEDAYGSSYLETTTYTYDEAGNRIEKDYQRAYRSEDRPDYQEIFTFAYDVAGNMIEEIESEYYFDSAGEPVLDGKYTNTWAYDESGRVVERVRNEDSDGDPATSNWTYTHTYAYGDSGVTSYEYRQLNTLGNVTVRNFTFTYTEAGQLTEKREMYDYNGDGADGFYIDTYTYDADGRLTGMENTDHSAVSGEPGEATWKTTNNFSYDADGRLIGWINEYFSNGSDIRNRAVAEATYDEEGTSASGTIEILEWDPAAEDGAGALVPIGPARPMNYTFAAGAPTAAMEIPVETLPYYNYEARDFEIITLTVEQPALYAIGNAALLGDID